MLVLSSIDHRVQAVARQVHALRIAAYEQEAKLLGVVDFPPLKRGLEDILNSSEEFVGAFEEESLAGVISTCPDEEGRGRSISSLVVHPTCQRRGIGSALLRAATQQNPNEEITIQTAAANTRALALYSQFGFKEFRRWCYGGETLELVKLSRPPAQTQSAA